MKTWFCKKEYPQKLVDAQHKSVSEKGLDELFEGPDKKVTGATLVVIYQPRFHKLSVIIRKYFTFLHPAFISFRSGRYLKNHLVRAKVCPFIKEKGTFQGADTGFQKS